MKYQYTYFIEPYVIDDKNFKNYILKLLNDKRCSYKIFEKEKDLDIYNFFLPNIRELLFPTFDLRGQKLKDFNNLSIDEKLKFIFKQNVSFFTYDFAQDIQGKVGTEDGIFFKIEGIEIICFKNGICFFTMKTHLENTNKFTDILNFNYRFKEINSEFASLKDFDNIKIQTDTFRDINDLAEFINMITGFNQKKYNNKEKIINSQFYTFSYVCVETSNWNEKCGIENIENEFYKYANVLPSTYLQDINKPSFESNLKIIDKFKYSKVAITNRGSNLLCSGIDTYNYTKLPYEYENQYFYMYILSLYKKLFLLKLNVEFKNYDVITKRRKDLTKFVKTIWNKEVTLDDNGTAYYNKINETLNLDSLFYEIDNKYELIYKNYNIEKNNSYFTVMVILLIFSLIFNTINIIFLLYLLS